MTVSALHIPPRFSPRAILRGATALVTATALMLVPLPALAQAPENKGPPTIRDAEIEQLLRDYTSPVLRAAGLTKQNVQVVIINEPTFNAFVVDGRRIFVNSGALMESADAEPDHRCARA